MMMPVAAKFVLSSNLPRLGRFRWFIAPVLLASLFCGVLVCYAEFVRLRAQAILKEVRALKVGTSSIGDVDGIAARIGQSASFKTCRDGVCDFEFFVENSWLHKLRLEPLAFFRAQVTTQRGIIQKIRVELMRDTRVFPTFPSAGMVTEYAVYPEPYKELKPYAFPQPVGKPYLDVKLNAEATPDQRQRAYAFSLRCLTKLGSGCDLPCDYLPLAWRDWTPQWENEPHLRQYYPDRGRCR